MIKTNNLDEYVTLKAIKSYCSNLNPYGECHNCKFEEICNAFPKVPMNIEIIYEESKDEQD